MGNRTFWGNQKTKIIYKNKNFIAILIRISYILEFFIRHNKKTIPEMPDKEIQYIFFNSPKIKRILLSN